MHAASADWLRRFHDGDRAVIEDIYRRHFAALSRALGTLLGPADRETAIHEVFLRLLTQPALRASFQGGELGAWLGVVLRNHAIDSVRHLQPESLTDRADSARAAGGGDASALDARIMIERFRCQILPPRWASVFETRFLRQLTQAEAAKTLGIRRSTLAYQEARVRRLLRRFLLKEGP